MGRSQDATERLREVLKKMLVISRTQRSTEVAQDLSLNHTILSLTRETRCRTHRAKMAVYRKLGYFLMWRMMRRTILQMGGSDGQVETQQECGTTTANHGCVPRGSGMLLLWAERMQLTLESVVSTAGYSKASKPTWYIPNTIPYAADADADIRCREGDLLMPNCCARRIEPPYLPLFSR